MLRLLSSRVSCLALLALACASACGGSNNNGGNGGGGGGGSSGGGSSGGGGDPPHALGIVLLGESHAPSGGGSSVPVVSASFMPDSTALPKTCGTQVSGCTFVAAPQCGTTGSACGVGETCTWDSSCKPTCKAECTLQCAAGQECYFPSPNQPACRTAETFDAGAVAFAGTTTPITLFPPYQYASTSGGSPFLAGAPIEVQASGAAGAGFDKFDEKFTATTFLQTNPPIDTIPAATVFGTGPIPLSWTPGSDTIVVTVSGAGGVGTCTATDTAGTYQVPRAVVSAALGKGSSSLSLAVSRERDDWKKSETTHGQMVTAKVQPVGWLELTTTSTESASFQGCSIASETMCPDGCFDTQVDQYHCGSCATVCGANQTCVNGGCSTGTSTNCTTCETSAESGSCSSYYTSCELDSQCMSYAACAQGCGTGNTTCLSTCQSSYPTGYTEYANYTNCICFTACPTQCASLCGQ
jgi:hypothetical protein